MISAAKPVIGHLAAGQRQITMCTTVDESRGFPVLSTENHQWLPEHGAGHRTAAELGRAAGDVPMIPEHGEDLAGGKGVWRIVFPPMIIWKDDAP